MLPSLLTRRVLMTTDAVGGIWTYGLDLGRGLVARGARVTLAVLGPPVDTPRRAQAEAAGVQVIDTGLAPEWLAEDAAEVGRAGRHIEGLAHDGGFDLLHLNHPALAADTRYPCPVVGVAHSCVASWWEAVRGTDLPDDFGWRTRLVGRGYAAVDRLVAPSQAFAEAAARLYGGQRSIVVHNGRTSPAGHPTADRPADRVFFAGRLWDEGKNLATLDAAAALVGCPVSVAGPLAGPNGSAVSVSHVESLGSLGEMALARQLAQCPIFCSPALYEPFGLAVVEAAQAGCALVLSDIPSHRELWSDAALFVPARDAAGFAAAIETLRADPHRRRTLSEAAAARARHYSAERFVEGTLAVHAGVLAPAVAVAS